MTPERHQLLQRIYLEACAHPPEARPAFLDQACGDDAELRALAEALLAQYADAVTYVSSANPGPAARAEGAAGGRLSAGTLVDGKYRVEALVGRGGMGEVYRALQLNLGRQVALKVLPAGADPRAGTRFEREALAVARLRHPHIVTIHDLGLSPGVGAFIVMEYVDGRSLRQELDERGQLPAGEAVALMRQVCSAVQAAHEAGVLHRDLKPENILLEEGSAGTAAKVLDFGIAKLAGASEAAGTGLTREGTVMGTPLYMSPEQCLGEELDARSDVYALGCVTYELLTGRPPFEAATSRAVLVQHATAEPTAPSRRREGLCAGLDATVLRALAKRREDRFATAGAFAEALASALEAAGDSLIRSAPVRETRGESPAEPARAAQPAAGDGRPVVANNLPQPLTRFIGRAGEAEAVRRQLASERLTTLVGVGGIGKTRLALEVARAALADFPDGVWLVELAALAEPSLVSRAVASTLGVREEPGRTLVETLAAQLMAKRVLVVLDNCEHVVEACAELADALLRACRNLRVLATSREVLGTPGEAVWSVPPLSVPAPARASETPDVSAYEATRLFADRAALSRSGFATNERVAPLVMRICRRLDGIPLAIELAAACVKVLSVEQILAKLDDRFRLLSGGSRTGLPHHKTLRAAIDWSYDLLKPEEQWLFRRLSVFSGGWTLAAAEAVCADRGPEILGPVPGPSAGEDGRERNDGGPAGTEGDAGPARGPAARPLSPEQVLEVLAHLVDKSLVNVEQQESEARYSMLETIREYAREKLGGSPEAPGTAERHRDWFLGFAERAHGELVGPEQGAWLRRFEAEHENLRAALRFSLEGEGDEQACLRLCTALGNFWSMRGHVSEGRRWCDAALAHATRAPTGARARALEIAGKLAMYETDLVRASALLEEAVTLQRAIKDQRGLRNSLYSLGHVMVLVGDYDRAATIGEENLALCRELGDREAIAIAGEGLGKMAVYRGEFDRAVRWLEESLSIFRDNGSKRNSAIALLTLSKAVRYRGEYDRAERLLEECAEIARELGDAFVLAESRLYLGNVATDRGEYDRALPLFKAVVTTLRELNASSETAAALEGMARVAAGRGDARRALRLAGAASRLREGMRSVMAPPDRAALDRHLNLARPALPREDAEGAFAEGRALTLEQALREALEDME